MTATIKTLVDFNGPDGNDPQAGLIADSNGDLFGTAAEGGANDDGTVFEIKKTASGYASTPTTLVSFDYLDGESPEASLLADANGDLLGTTAFGIHGLGAVFEIAKTPTGYASAPIILADFGSEGGLIADANGNLFGTDGSAFEIAETPTGYASTATTLASFSYPGSDAGLLADSAGDLFGTTHGGEAENGTVFEIAKTPTSYASTPTTLVSFNFADGSGPVASLIADADGDLFGTTSAGGPGNLGTVFEIRKTATGYASTPTVLVSFNSANGESPLGALVADANGDLFGTTSGFSPFSGAWPETDGTVFEIKKTAAGYASAPITLVSFDGADGANPVAGLLADAKGDLFGTTRFGGADDDGTVFEIANSGFVTAGSPAARADDGILLQGANGQAALWGMDGTAIVAGGAVSPNPGPSWHAIGTGDFNDDGLPDILWQSSSGQAAIWDMDGTTLIGGGAVNPNPGPSWKAIGTGDFNDDGHSDILWQNASGQAAVWDMNGSALIGGGAVSPNPGPGWKAIGTGDFNGDGRADILWQNAGGQAAVWDMNGSTLIGGGAVSPNPGPSWKVIGSGDFNDDGRSDLLWQNASSGQVAIWEMNGNHLIGGGAVATNPGPSWHAIGTGDFNGDGHSDILFQSTSGQTAVWDMNGTNIVGGGAVSANAGPSWRAVGLV